jgi:hypothetical protein
MNEEEKNTSEDEEEFDKVEDEGQETELDEEQETETDDTDQQDETVPLSTYLDIKNKYKMTKKEYQSLKDKTMDSDLKEYKETTKNKYLKLGYNEDLAEQLAEDLAENRSLVTKRKDSMEESIIEDIQELKSDPIYSDIDYFKDEIIQKIKETKKKGYDLDIEDAYFIVSKQGKTKAREQRQNDTQREVLNKKKKGAVSTNVATSGSEASKNKYKLDEDDKKALATLQRMQPDSKWTPEKYFKMMKE